MKNKTDREKIIEGALAILSLSRHSDNRVWKSIDWDILDELYNRGWISNPATKAKSVLLTDDGLNFAENFLTKYFGKQRDVLKTKVATTSKKVQDITNLIPNKSHIIRCTSKLLKELRVKPVEQEIIEVNSIREWHANIITVQRKKCIVFTHSMSLYSFVIFGVKRKELDNLSKEFSKHLASNLFADQIDSSKLIGNREFETKLIYTKTNNRSVLGSMNDITYQIEMSVYNWPESKEIDSIEISQHLNKIPMGALKYGFPDRELKKLLK